MWNIELGPDSHILGRIDMEEEKKKSAEEKAKEAIAKAKKMAEESHCQQCDAIMCDLKADEEE
jgi:hypothetical protein